MYSKLLSQKRKWKPINPVYTPVVQGAEEVLSRALSLRIMELSVADFLDNATKKDLPLDEDGMTLIRDNMSDESVHDMALNNLVASLPFSCDYPEAHQFKAFANELANKTHPIETVRTIEVGIFFIVLPILRFFGNSAAKTVASDISGDERIHVATHTKISKDIQTFTAYKELSDFRREVVAWMTSPLSPDKVPAAYSKYASQDFWLKQSDSLYFEGKADGLKDTKKGSYLAFFEIDRRNQPRYN
ncbi:MAG: hypothetical protein ACK4NC_07310 [Candidatus Gracilibacteria bacterium]